MLQIALSEEMVCNDPEPRARFREFGESGLKLQLLGWIERPELRGRVIDKLSTLVSEFKLLSLALLIISCSFLNPNIDDLLDKFFVPKNNLIEHYLLQLNHLDFYRVL